MFAAFPGMNTPGMMPQAGMYPMAPGINDFENRFASLERQIRKLDARISRLEGSSGIYSSDPSNYNTSLGDGFNQNMYPNSMHMM